MPMKGKRKHAAFGGHHRGCPKTALFQRTRLKANLGRAFQHLHGWREESDFPKGRQRKPEGASTLGVPIRILTKMPGVQGVLAPIVRWGLPWRPQDLFCRGLSGDLEGAGGGGSGGPSGATENQRAQREGSLLGSQCSRLGPQWIQQKKTGPTTNSHRRPCLSKLVSAKVGFGGRSQLWR